jgi:hypothetical protein
MNDFLQALYGDLEDGDHWYIWTLAPDRAKASTWFAGPACEQAAAFCAAQNGVNVYWPIAFAAEQGSPRERMTIGTVAGIVGLVADVDFQSETHPHAPPDATAAGRLIERFPLLPTAVVHSGNGLQAVWMFREPWRFDSDAERGSAQQIARGWAYGLAQAAAKLSWALDPVHDITRVMRVPGTYNVKRPGHPLPVVLLELDNDRRYNPEDIEQYCADVPSPEGISPVAVDLSADFPIEKHEALLTNLDEYRQTWEHNRKALAGKSASEHDMALASYAVLSGWADNEIAAMLREHQRLHGNKPEKLADARYFGRTIAKARSSLGRDEKYQQAGEVLADPEHDRDERIQALAQRWEVPLQNVQRVTGDPTIYRLWIGGKCAEIDATSLVNQQGFLGAMISVANMYPRPVGQKESPGWRDYVNVLCAIAEEVEVGPAATVAGEFLDLISGFIESQAVVDTPPGELVNGHALFRRDGRIWFKPESLHRYLQHSGYKQNRRRVAQYLRTLGAEFKLHKTEHSENGSHPVRYWGVTAIGDG